MSMKLLKGIIKRTDLYRSAPLFLLIMIIAFSTLGCTVDDPGYVVTADDSKAQIVDSDNNIVAIDDGTGSFTVIDYSHYKVHAGDAYYIQGNSDDLDNGNNLDLTVITDNTANWMHAVWLAEGTDAIHIFIYEGATVNVTGTAVTPYNRDRNSSNTPSGVFRDGDTFTNTGTLIWEWHTGDKNAQGFGEQRNEIILAQNTTYLFRIQSEVDNNAVTGELSWYEHTNR